MQFEQLNKFREMSLDCYENGVAEQQLKNEVDNLNKQYNSLISKIELKNRDIEHIHDKIKEEEKNLNLEKNNLQHNKE